MADKLIVVLVHGWSVHSTTTYGKLPERLRTQKSIPVDVRHIWLSRYISFKDEVRMEDLSRGFESALQVELGEEISTGRKIAFITHSTGGPVIRDWWDRFYHQEDKPCPMSHLIMLAPANFGSALAQLGKGRLSQLKSATKNVEPGQGVLDWLELGSPESWDLNSRWIQDYEDPSATDDPTYLFSLSGQTIDRKFYDHVNSYTGELGSDGTVRLAAANMNARYVRIEQEEPQEVDKPNDLMVVEGYSAPRFKKADIVSKTAPRTAFSIVPGCSHVGKTDGILFSIKESGPHEALSRILRCLKVNSKENYDQLCDDFEKENQEVREKERVEILKRPILSDPRYIHDSMSMLIMRVRDDQGHVINDFDLLFTGPKNSPDLLPEGFFRDRQRNSRDRGVITYFINHDLLAGTTRVKDPVKSRRTLRDAVPPLKQLGLQVEPRPRANSYVHYLVARLRATQDTLKMVVGPDQTTMLDIVMKRCVRKGVHQIERSTDDDFRDQALGGLIDF